MAEAYDFSRASVHCMTDSWVLKDGLPKARGEDGVKMSPLYSACPTVVLLGDDGLWFCVNASHDINRLVTSFVNCLWDRRLLSPSAVHGHPDGNGVCCSNMDGDLYFSPKWVFELRNKARNHPDLMRMVLGMPLEQSPMTWVPFVDGDAVEWRLLQQSPSESKEEANVARIVPAIELYDPILNCAVQDGRVYPHGSVVDMPLAKDVYNGVTHWFCVNGMYGIDVFGLGESDTANRIVRWLMSNMAAAEDVMPKPDKHGFITPASLEFHLSADLYKELRSMKKEEEIRAYLRTGRKPDPTSTDEAPSPPGSDEPVMLKRRMLASDVRMVEGRPRYPETWPIPFGAIEVGEAYPGAVTLYEAGRDRWVLSESKSEPSSMFARLASALWAYRASNYAGQLRADGTGVVKAILYGVTYWMPKDAFDLRLQACSERDLRDMLTGRKEAPVPQQITTAHVKEAPVASDVAPAAGNVEGTIVQPDSPHPSITARIIGGNSDMVAVRSDRASQATPTYIGGGPSNVISGPGGAIFADGRNAVIGGGNSGLISTVAVPSKFCSEDIGPTARRANTTEGKLNGIPSHAVMVNEKTDARVGEGGYTLVCHGNRPTILLRTPLGDVVVHEDVNSNKADLDAALALCMLYPLYSAAWLQDQGLEQRLGMQAQGIGTWLMQATPTTWKRIQDHDGWYGRKSLIDALMTERTYIRMEEEMTHMAQLKNAEEAVPHVDGATAVAVIGKPKRPAKERAKAAAKKAGKDALDDAKEALFRGTVRNTVKEVHGTAITIAKGVTDNDTAMMVVALMETERGKAALAAGFGAILGFMIDMLEGEHPALERVARELKVENGSVLMDPIIGAVLAPLAQLFARVCLMAGDKSAADQVHKITAPLQLVAAGGTLLADEVRVAEKAVK